MTRFVVDASVAAKWFLPEEHAAAAVRLQGPDHELSAPDLLVAEIANVMLKRLRAGELGEEDAQAAVALLPVMTQLMSSVALAPEALRIALRHDRSTYDAIYVALALRDRCPLITADRRLYNALRHHLPDTVVLWIEDIA